MVAKPHEIHVDLPHLRLAARAWGDPALPRLLALHGWLDNSATFDTLAPLLCGKFHIVAVDLPGHGRSDWRAPGAWYHYIDYLGDVLAAADALGWSRFGLLGHSLGAAVASMLAGILPERIDRLWLLEGLGPLAQDLQQVLPQLRRAFAERAQSGARPLRVFRDLAEAAAARMKASDLSQAAALHLVARGTKAVAGGLSWSSDPRLTLTSPVRYTEQQILAVLAGIEVRSLLVLAQPQAGFFTRAMVDARTRVVKRMQVQSLPGGHHLHLDEAQAVADAILEFERRTCGNAE